MSKSAVNRLKTFGMATALCFVAGIAQADDAEMLNKIGDAVRSLNYQGVMVYARDGEMHSLQIVHRNRNGREQERLQALTGEAREVLRDNDVVTCILPEERKVLVDRHDIRGPLSTVAAMSADSLAPHYTIKQENDQRLVDRNCKVLSLVPNDDYRYGYRLWIDEITSLPLRIDLLGSKGQTLEQVMFTQVSFPEEIEDKALKPAVDPRDYVWLRQNSASNMRVKKESGKGIWQIHELPPGFELISHNLLETDAHSPAMETFLFSDGLATVSAIIKPQGEKPSNLLGLSQMGAMNAYGKEASNYHVAVMGEVPADTVRFIAEHLRAHPLTTVEKQ